MENRNIAPFMSFWQNVFSIGTDITQLKGTHISFDGPYLKRDPDLIYLFKSTDMTVLAISPQKWEEVFPDIRQEDVINSEELLLAALKPLHIIFDDIDHDLPSEVISKWNVDSLSGRFLSPNDHELLNEFYLDCSEDDRDTTEPNLETDTAWGLFEEDRLVSLASFYKVPNTDIADLTVVTANKCRGRNYAMTSLKAIIRDAFAKGLVPRYRARKGNLATLNVAQKLGFLPHCSITVFQTSAE